MVAKHDRQTAVLFENVQRMLAPAPVKKKLHWLRSAQRLNLIRTSFVLVSTQFTFNGAFSFAHRRQNGAACPERITDSRTQRRLN
jgi:hypothetical protein